MGSVFILGFGLSSLVFLGSGLGFVFILGFELILWSGPGSEINEFMNTHWGLSLDMF